MHYHPLHHKRTATENSRRLLLGDIVGWIGAVSIIGAYLLVSFSIVSAHTYLYQILNIIGASGLLTLAIVRRAYPSVTTNVVWILIGIVAIIGLVLGI